MNIANRYGLETSAKPLIFERPYPTPALLRHKAVIHLAASS